MKQRRIGGGSVAAHTGNGPWHHPSAGPYSHSDTAPISAQASDLLLLGRCQRYKFVAQIPCGQNHRLGGLESQVSLVPLPGNDGCDAIPRFLQLFCHCGKMEHGTMLLCQFYISRHCFRNSLVMPQFLREGGSADPGFDSTNVAGIFFGSRPIPHINIISLFLCKGFQEPVKAASAVFYKLHHKPGVAAIPAPQLPVVKKLDLIHRWNAF